MTPSERSGGEGGTARLWVVVLSGGETNVRGVEEDLLWGRC